MATPFDRLMDTARPYLPGAIDNAMKQQLFLVCQTFFADSNVWQENIPFSILPNMDAAEVTPFTGRIERLAWVTGADNKIPVRNATMPDTSTGLIYMPYAQVGDYAAQVIINVSDPISRDVFPIVPTALVDFYWQTLMDGLIANMMVLPSKPYTNLTLASVYMSKFRGGIARARNETNQLNTLGAQTWRFPSSFNRTKISRR